MRQRIPLSELNFPSLLFTIFILFDSLFMRYWEFFGKTAVKKPQDDIFWASITKCFLGQEISLDRFKSESAIFSYVPWQLGVKYEFFMENCFRKCVRSHVITSMLKLPRVFIRNQLIEWWYRDPILSTFPFGLIMLLKSWTKSIYFH